METPLQYSTQSSLKKIFVFARKLPEHQSSWIIIRTFLPRKNELNNHMLKCFCL